MFEMIWKCAFLTHEGKRYRYRWHFCFWVRVVDTPCLACKLVRISVTDYPLKYSYSKIYFQNLEMIEEEILLRNLGIILVINLLIILWTFFSGSNFVQKDISNLGQGILFKTINLKFWNCHLVKRAEAPMIFLYHPYSYIKLRGLSKWYSLSEYRWLMYVVAGQLPYHRWQSVVFGEDMRFIFVWQFDTWWPCLLANARW